MMKLHEISRLPTPNDNCAIALSTLDAGTTIEHGSLAFSLSHTILEGHRFAVEMIPAGSPLLSWGTIFGIAKRAIRPGEYICNTKVLNQLQSHDLPFFIPQEPNFSDELEPYQFDPMTFRPAPPTFDPAVQLPRQMFLGYARPGNRGVGTRNYMVILGVNGLVGTFVQQLEQMLRPVVESLENIDGIVAVAHTEGNAKGNNNETLLLRTLAGFMVHPNVGGVLCVDSGPYGVNNNALRQYAQANGYQFDDVPCAFLSLDREYDACLATGYQLVQNLLPEVNRFERTPQPTSELKIALQCGGSDAFSGISGNPLAAEASRLIIKQGGSAVLAETDELVGAEAYVLRKVKDQETAERFLHMIDRFQIRAAAHGQSGEGNPSGGNLYRGLYNIYLKSLGAATKRHPDVRLDGVVDYGEQLPSSGYFFMDSPGNDLESIAGQVASGCNLIYFVTGNGSITNFPFVPTIKIVTTTDRFTLLANDMDINAGAYLDGKSMEGLGEQLLAETVQVAAGKRSSGERANHSQVQIWRNWQIASEMPATIPSPHTYSGAPIQIETSPSQSAPQVEMWQTGQRFSTDLVGLILPTSLCSGQIARMAVNRLNEMEVNHPHWPNRFVTLVHTEGCGASIQAEYIETILSYVQHPMVRACLFMEHGCESTHNRFWLEKLKMAGLDPDQFGWTSIQKNGGIAETLKHTSTWFKDVLSVATPAQRSPADFAQLKLGIITQGDVQPQTAEQLAQLCQIIVCAGGTVVLPNNDGLIRHPDFCEMFHSDDSILPTIGYAQRWQHAGLHIMDSPSNQWVEQTTGLCASGVETVVAITNTAPQLGNPLTPMLQFCDNKQVYDQYTADYDGMIGTDVQQLIEMISNTVAQRFIRRLCYINVLAFR